VTAQLSALSQIGQPEDAESSVWIALRALDAKADSVVRISSLPARFLSASEEILRDDYPGVYTCIDPRRGVLRVVVAPDREDEDTSTALGFSGGIVSDGNGSSELIFEKLPTAEVWAHVSPSVVADPLSQGIKKAYDPNNILNPGILGD
jgi:hypothetical protein